MNNNAQMAKLRYQVATFSGTLHIPVYDDWNEDLIKAKARAQLARASGGSLPMGYEKFTVIERR